MKKRATIVFALCLVICSLTACGTEKQLGKSRTSENGIIDSTGVESDTLDKTKLKRDTDISNKGQLQDRESTDYIAEEPTESEDTTEAEDAIDYVPEDFDPDALLWSEVLLAKGNDNYNFSLEGVEYSWPIMLTDLTDNGWGIGESFLNKEVEPGGYAGLIATKGEKEITLTAVNKSKESVDIMECNLSEIRVAYYNWNDLSTKVEFTVQSDGVQLGDVNKDSILENFNWDKDASQPNPTTEGGTMTSYTKIENTTLSDGYTREIGRVTYVFETPESKEDYLAQICIEYIGE